MSYAFRFGDEGHPNHPSFSDVWWARISREGLSSSEIRIFDPWNLIPNGVKPGGWLFGHHWLHHDPTKNGSNWQCQKLGGGFKFQIYSLFLSRYLGKWSNLTNIIWFTVLFFRWVETTKQKNTFLILWLKNPSPKKVERARDLRTFGFLGSIWSRWILGRSVFCWAGKPSRRWEKLFSPRAPRLTCSDNSTWWFQIFFMFIPVWGRFPIWLIFFKGVETTN